MGGYRPGGGAAPLQKGLSAERRLLADSGLLDLLQKDWNSVRFAAETGHYGITQLCAAFDPNQLIAVMRSP